MRSSQRARPLPVRFSVPAALVVFVAFAACNSITGADKLETGAVGAAGQGVVGAAGDDGTSGDGAGGDGTGGGAAGAGASGGANVDCDLAEDCSQCCVQSVSNVGFTAAVRTFFEDCLCEPAREREGSGSGKCGNVVEGCESCCTRLCDDGEASPADLAACAVCAGKQGASECKNPRGFCQTRYNDNVCNEYFDCIVENQCPATP